MTRHDRFVKALREEMAKSGCTHGKFCLWLGISPPRLTMWLNGTRKNPRWETVVRIWKATGRSLDKDFLQEI